MSDYRSAYDSVPAPGAWVHIHRIDGSDVFGQVADVLGDEGGDGTWEVTVLLKHARIARQDVPGLTAPGRGEYAGWYEVLVANHRYSRPVLTESPELEEFLVSRLDGLHARGADLDRKLTEVHDLVTSVEGALSQIGI